jgi:hypothetical protein
VGAAGGKTEEAEDEPSAAMGAEEEEQQHLQLASSAGSEESLAACLLRLHLLRVLPRRCPWSGRTSFVVGSRAISLSLSHLLKGRAREREEEKRGAIKEEKKQWRGEHISSALSQRDSFFLLLREFADTTNSFSHRHKTKQNNQGKKCEKNAGRKTELSLQISPRFLHMAKIPPKTATAPRLEPTLVATKTACESSLPLTRFIPKMPEIACGCFLDSFLIFFVY